MRMHVASKTSLAVDIRESVVGVNEARYLVDTYYQLQEYRKATGNQAIAMEKADEPHVTTDWLFDELLGLEKGIKNALSDFAEADPLATWAMSICGVGPVISAGLRAHIDISKAQTAGAIWRFAGLDPTVSWGKGEKRPWNAKLKTLCWKIGESFVKVSGNDKDIYGHIWAERKALELERNEAGEFADQAARALEKKIGKNTEAYKWYSEGKLPPGHIHARAKRYAVKMFLSHYFEVGYVMEHGKRPPAPYIIENGGHAHYMPPPNFDVV